MVNRTTLNTIRNTRDASGDAFAVGHMENLLRSPVGVLMKIVDYYQISANRWLYTIQEAGMYHPDAPSSGAGYLSYDGFTLVDGMYSGNNNSLQLSTNKAINIWELGNTAARVFPGLNTANFPAGYAVGPVEGYVLCYPGFTGEVGRTPFTRYGCQSVWMFNAPNPIEGECA